MSTVPPANTALGLAEAEQLAIAALVASRTLHRNAVPTARALVAAEADGQAGHGLSRVPSYALHARTGKVDGSAIPRVERAAPAVLRVDAGFGFAYPAIDAALDALAPLARETGVALAAVHRSHHFGQAGAHAERLAGQGLVGLSSETRRRRWRCGAAAGRCSAPTRSRSPPRSVPGNRRW
jgi:(2R)-3-sulfolactate dehydrogenase (NADP+)